VAQAHATGRTRATRRRQRLWRDLALIVTAPLLLYLLACLVSYSPDDPSGSNSGSHRAGPITSAAWLAPDRRPLFRCSAMRPTLPVILGAVAWTPVRPGRGGDELGRPCAWSAWWVSLIALTGMLDLRLYIGTTPRPVAGRPPGRALAVGRDGPLGSSLFLVVLLRCR
jgi:S-DNA-T family DNA segregation ATPase FtsK/SpoIIIE